MMKRLIRRWPYTLAFVAMAFVAAYVFSELALKLQHPPTHLLDCPDGKTWHDQLRKCV